MAKKFERLQKEASQFIGVHCGYRLDFATDSLQTLVVGELGGINGVGQSLD